MSLTKSKPVLTLMVGLPRSGKSSVARESGAPIVSPDAIRLSLHGTAFRVEAEPMVWAIAKLMVSALFEAGHYSVTLDACNITHKRRQEWHDPRWSTTFWHIPTDKEECLRRARQEGNLELLPIIERMAAQFEPVTVEDFA